MVTKDKLPMTTSVRPSPNKVWDWIWSSAAMKALDVTQMEQLFNQLHVPGELPLRTAPGIRCIDLPGSGGEDNCVQLSEANCQTSLSLYHSCCVCGGGFRVDCPEAVALGRRVELQQGSVETAISKDMEARFADPAATFAMDPSLPAHAGNAYNDGDTAAGGLDGSSVGGSIAMLPPFLEASAVGRVQRILRACWTPFMGILVVVAVCAAARRPSDRTLSIPYGRSGHDGCACRRACRSVVAIVSPDRWSKPSLLSKSGFDCVRQRMSWKPRQRDWGPRLLLAEGTLSPSSSVGDVSCQAGSHDDAYDACDAFALAWPRGGEDRGGAATERQEAGAVVGLDVDVRLEGLRACLALVGDIASGDGDETPDHEDCRKDAGSALRSCDAEFERAGQRSGVAVEELPVREAPLSSPEGLLRPWRTPRHPGDG